MDPEIPDKLYFRIGEVAALTGIKPHVLRYWESEFRTFRPNKSTTRQRLYQRKDIELVLRLKDLLYQQGFTIAGARKALRDRLVREEPAPSSPPSYPSSPRHRQLEEIRRDLLSLRDRLTKDP